MQPYPSISELPEAVTLAIEIIKANAVAARVKEFAKALYTVEGVVLSVVPGEPIDLPKHGDPLVGKDIIAEQLDRLGLVLGDVIDDELPTAGGFNPLWIIALIQWIQKLIDMFKLECPCPDPCPHNED